MTSTDRADFGTAEAMRPLLSFFRQQVELLASVQPAVRERDGATWSVLDPLLYSVVDTGRSIAWLAEGLKVRDTFVLSRVAYETVVNACFVLAQGEPAAERAQRHAAQRAYRDLSREVEINGQTIQLKWSGAPDAPKDVQPQAAVDEFTSRKGREITSWTPETVKERIQAVHSRYGEKASTGLQFGLLAVYRHSSEIAHGSLFGAMFALGLTQPNGPPTSPDDLVTHFRSNTSMLLLLLGMSIDSLLFVLGQELGETDFVEESQAAIRAIQELPWIKAS
jgi:hypothetical protein